MKKGLLCVLGAGCLASCATPSGELSPVPRDVGVEEARRLVARGQVVPIDMRSPNEFSSGHIPGAVLVPFGSGGTAKQVSRAMGGKQGLIYCRIGKRTRLALQELSGIPGILHFPGGFTEWKTSGGPIEKGIEGPLGAESALERQKIGAEHKTDVYDFF